MYVGQIAYLTYQYILDRPQSIPEALTNDQVKIVQILPKGVNPLGRDIVMVQHILTGRIVIITHDQAGVYLYFKR